MVSSLFQRPGVVFLLLVVAVVGGLAVGSATTPVGAFESHRHEAAAAVEDAVRAVAWYGPQELQRPRYQAAFSSFQGRGTLLVLLSAWSRLSLGRLGILDVTTATRLPWLVLAGLGPAFGWWSLRRELGAMPALSGALVVVAFPGWWQSAVGAASWSVVLSSHLVVVGVHRAPIRLWCRVFLLAVVMGFLVNVHVASLVALALVAVSFWWRSRASGWRHGRATLPVDVVAAVIAVPLMVWALNPALWGRSASGLVRWSLAVVLPAPSESPIAVGWVSAGWALMAMGSALTTAWLVRRWQAKA